VGSWRYIETDTNGPRFLGQFSARLEMCFTHSTSILKVTRWEGLRSSSDWKSPPMNYHLGASAIYSGLFLFKYNHFP